LFYRHEWDWFATFDKNIWKKFPNKKMVKIKKVDSILLNENFDLIKIDVEHFEYYVIKWALKLIERSNADLIVEIWNKDELERIEKLLKDHGLHYLIKKITNIDYFFQKV
jgi:hypothetical protein